MQLAYNSANLCKIAKKQQTQGKTLKLQIISKNVFPNVL